jgi:hypothetical protein
MDIFDNEKMGLQKVKKRNTCNTESLLGPAGRRALMQTKSSTYIQSFVRKKQSISLL